MSRLDAALLLIALSTGVSWLCLTTFVLGSRMLYDLRLGSLRTQPEAWPVRGGEAVPKLAAPALFGAEVGTLAATTRSAPVAPRAPVVPRRSPVLPVTPAPAPAPAEPVVARSRPKRIRPFHEPVAAGETGSHVAA